MKQIQQKAFTLIELLVVIAIIGILSSVVLASLSGARNSARETQAKQELNEIKDLIVLAHGNEAADLGDITGSYCTGCSYRDADDDDPKSAAAINDFKNSLANIYNAANKGTSTLKALATDPWGQAYFLDENEGENGPNDCDGRDYLESFGADGEWSTSDDIEVVVPFGHSCL